MSQATYIQDMMTDPESDLPTGSHEIANFYTGRNVLITGASGFLGRLLVERILRSCSGVNTLFLLLRAKKGKSPEERFKELFDDVIFDRLRGEHPKFYQKVVLIEGDVGQVGLGLSSEQRALLLNTHIVIHGAATVRFDEKLRNAANINVRGTQELLFLAKEMMNLKAFVHISTAYSNCVHKVIDEKFYPPPIGSEKLLQLLDLLDDAVMDRLSPVIMGKWPNTYAFTKAIAEDTIRRSCHILPLCIVRPSIVLATSKEPVAGWINNVYGAVGIVVGAGIGLLRTLHCNSEIVADMIPADYVISNVIVAAWDTAQAYDKRLNVNSKDGGMFRGIEHPPIYNVVSSCQNPVTWGELMKHTSEYGVQVPSVLCIWYYCFRLNKHRWVHNLSVFFLHLIPAAIVDSLAWLTGRKPMLWKAYKKIHKFSSVIEYFALQQWEFRNNNAVRLWEKLGPADRAEFDLDIGNLDWAEFFRHQICGLRVFLVNDSFDTLPQARAKYAKLKVAHYTLIMAAYGFLFWLLWTFLQFIGLF